MDAEEIAKVLDGLIHAETQVHDGGVDLTVAEVHAVRSPGELDVGGGELVAAETDAVPTQRREPEDDYAWWELGKGHYIIEYNEALSLEHRDLRLEPRDALLDAGAFHPTITVVEGLPRVPLAVSGPGLKIKETARVSTLRPPGAGR